jgi:hypothetical protein
MSNDLRTEQTQNSPQEEIALRAYHLWEERGRPIGSPQEHWSRAEDEMRREEAVEDERVRARNEAVRNHHHVAEEGPPPFTDFSGSL